jgi:NAD(P)-dependent dehydrogenase (short-subunit alcohol dehydrogenase family)
MAQRLDKKASCSCLYSFSDPVNVAVIGASGGLGTALISEILRGVSGAKLHAFSRRRLTDMPEFVRSSEIELENEVSISNAAKQARQHLGSLSGVFVATGLLHDGQTIQPEKSWRSLDTYSLEQVFRINAIGPALVAKHFLPLLKHDDKSVFACLSARVGSIEDNRLGGWYAYRASKAALNMIIKTLSIELARSNPNAVCIGLHPGTVDTVLSKPFQGNVQANKLFSPEKSAKALLSVIDELTPEDSGKNFAWDGAVIPS